MTEIKEVYAGTREEWRKWLKKNWNKETRVYLIKHKKHTGKPSLNNKDAMEEAICFGWIDTTVKRLDEDTYRQTFAKRGKNSRWSNNTLRYAREMIAQGKMTPYGMEMYEQGLKKPVLDHGLGDNPDVPKELEKELKKAHLMEEFDALAKSYRKTLIIWVARAVRKETKDKRIRIIVEKLRNGEKVW